MNQIIGMLGYLIPLVILSSILKSAWFKGITGEFMVNVSAKLFLNNEKYQLIKNVTLSTEDGTTQIDHIIISKYGIFVLETKNMKGWIFGSPHQKTWTQKIYKYSNTFQNPLHQNYKHIKTLQSLLGLNEQQIFSIIIFVGDSSFKTAMPENVTHGTAYIRFIKSKTQVVLTELEVNEIIHRIKINRLNQSFKTHREHIKHVKSIVAEKENVNTKICPKCGSSMVMREAKKGQNIGNKFWGCSNFPKCKGIVNASK